MLINIRCELLKIILNCAWEQFPLCVSVLWIEHLVNSLYISSSNTGVSVHVSMRVSVCLCVCLSVCVCVSMLVSACLVWLWGSCAAWTQSTSSQARLWCSSSTPWDGTGSTHLLLTGESSHRWDISQMSRSSHRWAFSPVSRLAGESSHRWDILQMSRSSHRWAFSPVSRLTGESSDTWVISQSQVSHDTGERCLLAGKSFHRWVVSQASTFIGESSHRWNISQASRSSHRWVFSPVSRLTGESPHRWVISQVSHLRDPSLSTLSVIGLHVSSDDHEKWTHKTGWNEISVLSATVDSLCVSHKNYCAIQL